MNVRWVALRSTHPAFPKLRHIFGIKENKGSLSGTAHSPAGAFKGAFIPKYKEH
ncbi:Uncharacterized protein dnm_056000 [Desulfonema magnum]|uniref:Uncharacterized protein n=1 Tax=Desulfonema magnum TaxID=45655 RepID=A0A975BQW2_9BACT|nr:Uncharacterized protein dnm_056000 [Desulfonema magnum]